MPNLPTDQCPVAATPAADSAAAVEHFAKLLAFETDCWDVHVGLQRNPASFVLLDVRSAELYARGHIPLARSLPHGKISERNLTEYPPHTLFVVYCSGPHCNGADRAAVRLAALGRPVKKMIGGVTGWLDEGFGLEQG
jgi:rhodanese-related sulfurtransferase